MKMVSDLFQNADWKTEKHVPFFEPLLALKKSSINKVTISVGKEIPHPNTTAHHIKWIKLYFHPQGEKYPYEIGTHQFSSHGESINGADTSTTYSHPEASFCFKTEKPGTLYASSYCNIHGLWENSLDIAFE